MILKMITIIIGVILLVVFSFLFKRLLTLYNERLKQLKKVHQKAINRLNYYYPPYEMKSLEQGLKTHNDDNFLNWYQKWYNHLATIFLPDGSHMPLTNYVWIQRKYKECLNNK